MEETETALKRVEGYCIDSKTKWSDHFSYLGHYGDNIQWLCNQCAKKVSVSKSSTSNATRHYSTKHKKDIKNCKPLVATKRINLFEPNPEVIAKRRTIQKKFDTQVLKLLTVQGLPFDTVEKNEFRTMVACLNPHVRVLSKSTYVTRIDSIIEQQVIPYIKKILSASEAITLSLDIWTSRRGQSVLSIRCHFLDAAWKLFSRCISFEHFPERPTGDNIKQLFSDCLSKYDITIEKVRFVITDNGSNMIKAFKMTNVFDDCIEDFQNEQTDFELEDSSEDTLWEILLIPVVIVVLQCTNYILHRTVVDFGGFTDTVSLPIV